MSKNTNTTKIEVSIVNGVENIEVMLVPEGGGSPALQDAIAAEATIRQAEDAALQDAIAAEATIRQAEDAALQDAIDAEAVMRAAGDVALQDQITANRIHEHLAGVVDTSYAGPDPNSDPDPDEIPSIIIIDDWSVDPATQIDGAKYRVRTPGVRDGVHYPAGMIVEVVGGNFVAYGWNPVGADGKITEVTDAVAAEKTAREAWQQLAIDQFGLNIDRITATETAQAKRVRVDAVQTFSDAEMTQARSNIGAAGVDDVGDSSDGLALGADMYSKEFRKTVAANNPLNMGKAIQFNLSTLGIPFPSTHSLYGFKIQIHAEPTGSSNFDYKEFYIVMGFTPAGKCYYKSRSVLTLDASQGSFKKVTMGNAWEKVGDFAYLEVANTDTVDHFFQVSMTAIKF